MTNPTENLVVLWLWPTGYTAAIYAARANLNPLSLKAFKLGGLPGGQLMTTTEVENFPGFPQGITGPLMDQMKAQAERWGLSYIQKMSEVDLSQRPLLSALRSARLELTAL